MVMHNNHEENIEAVTKMSLQFLAEAIGQCPAGLECSTNRNIVFAVLGFQYGALQSAAYVAGLDSVGVSIISAGGGTAGKYWLETILVNLFK